MILGSNFFLLYWDSILYDKGKVLKVENKFRWSDDDLLIKIVNDYDDCQTSSNPDWSLVVQLSHSKWPHFFFFFFFLPLKTSEMDILF